MLIDANGQWLPRAGRPVASQVVLPLGLMYLAAAVREAFGSAAEVECINTAVDVDGLGELGATVASFAPDVVGIRALSVAKAFFESVATTVRTVRPTAVVVAGGPYPTESPAAVLEQPAVDFVVVGEGERSLVRLLEHLLGEFPLAEVPGLWFKREGRPVAGAPQVAIDSLDSLPLPDYGVIEPERYARVLSYGYTIRRQGLIQSSRGCPFSCTYCFKMMGERYRPRSPESVLREIEFLIERQGVRDIQFVDDTFNLDRSRVEAIFRGVLDRGLRCNDYFPSGLRADLMTEELVDLLVEAGTIWVTYAVETAVPRIQALAGRTFDVDKVAAIIDHTARRRVMVGLFFMVGFPSETFEEASATLQFVRERTLVTLPFFFAVKYFPGTKLTRLALDSGAITPETVAASASPYHAINAAHTSTLSPAQFADLFTVYLKDILLDGARLRHALEVQERFLTKEELSAVYGALLGRPIADPRRVFRHALSQ